MGKWASQEGGQERLSSRVMDSSTEATRVYLQTIPALLELLRSNEPAFQKDALEYQFRRVVVEILQRLAPTEGA